MQHAPAKAYAQQQAPRWMAALLVAGLGFGVAIADDSSPGKDAEARYRQEMAVCTSGRSQQDTATCQREAANALAEARRGQLTTAQAPEANATQRCNMLPMNQRDDCVARITQGDATGSVGGGGVLREHITIVPAPAPAPAQ